jgi:ubiquinone biosynthesis protein Coq4
MSPLKQIRCKLLVSLTHNIALPLLKHIRKPKPFPYSLAELSQMDEGTLGKELFDFIDTKDLSLLTHYARHDMKHIVLGYDTTEEGELCLQSFMLGNGRISFPVLATVLFGLCTAPEYWRKMWLSYRKGRSCISIHRWDWFSLIPADTKSLRNKIFTPKIQDHEKSLFK